jgi:hypothetical protein
MESAGVTVRSVDPVPVVTATPTVEPTVVPPAKPRLYGIKAIRKGASRVVVSGRVSGGSAIDRVGLRLTVRGSGGVRRRRTVSVLPRGDRFRFALKVRRLATRRVTLTYSSARRVVTLKRSAAR